MGSPCRNGVGDVIVISGVLLLVAVVFLIIGLFGPLAWVYASIGVSVLSFAFLLLGVRQRRVAPVAATGSTPALPTAPTATAAPAAPATAAISRDDDVTVVAPKSPEPVGAAAAMAGGAAAGGAAAGGAAAGGAGGATSSLRRTTAGAGAA